MLPWEKPRPNHTPPETRTKRGRRRGKGMLRRSNEALGEVSWVGGEGLRGEGVDDCFSIVQTR